jgi:plastocyanin
MKALILAAAVAVIPVSAQEPAKPAGPVPATVRVIAPAAEGEVGQTVTFKHEAMDAAGVKMDVPATAWFATPFDVGAAQPDGKVTFFSPGELTVGVLAGGKVGTTKIKIRPQAVARIDIAAPAGSVVAGGSAQLAAAAFSATGVPRHDAAITWTSEAPAIARVDAAGVVTGVAPGRATIRAASGPASATLPVTIVRNPVTSLAIEPASSSVRTGDVVRFSVTAKSGSGARVESPAIRWSVGGGPAATVESDGVFVAERPGAYVVTAMSGDRVATASVVVAPRNVQREFEVVGRAPVDEFQVLEQWITGDFMYVTSAIAGKLWVYDISNPAAPLKVDSLSFDARVMNDISTTADNKIGVLTREGASNRKNGIVILDTSDLAHPKVMTEYTESVTGGVHSAFIDGRHVYLTDSATGSLRIVSLEDPRQPKEVGRWQAETLTTNITAPTGETGIAGRYLHDVYVKDGLAYLAYWRNGLIVLDVGAGMKGGSPRDPKFVSQIRFNYHELYGDGWLAGAHTVFRNRQYLFVGDEVFPSNFDLVARDRIPVKGIVHVVDLSDVEHPREVAFYDVPEGGAHNVWVDNDVLYMGYYSAGARAVDVSGELRGDLYRQGREIARLWTGDPKGYRPNLPFTWGAQPHRGLIYFNDINSGIWITRLKPAADGGK